MAPQAHMLEPGLKRKFSPVTRVLVLLLTWCTYSMELLERPRFEDFHIKYKNRIRWQFLGNGFSLRDVDGRDITWFWGLIGDEDKQQSFDF